MSREFSGVTLDNWQGAPHNRWGFWHVGELIASTPIRREGEPAVLQRAPLTLSMPGLESRLHESHTDAIIVLRGGKIVHEQYLGGAEAGDRHVLMSVSKSLCGLVVGCLVERGLLHTDRQVADYVPLLASSAYGDATIQQVLDMTVAVKYSEDYPDPSSHVQTQDRVAGWRTRLPGDPSDTYQFLTTLRHHGEHGRRFNYVSAGTDVLAWVIESVTGESYAQAVSTELWSRIGASHDAEITVDPGGFAFANGGISCTARDLALVGQLMLRGGRLGGSQIVPEPWVADTIRGGDQRLASGTVFQSIHPEGSYRNQWWVTGDAHGSFYASGIHGQYIWVDPKTEVVVVKFSSWPEAITEPWSRLHAALFSDISRAAAL